MATISNAQVYVDASATGSNDGSSWTNAYTDLQMAIGNSATGTQLWVAAGTYSPGSATTDFFDLSTPGLEIYGGFVGTETMLSQRDYSTNITILSGDVNGDDVDDDFSNNRADNNLHVMIIDDTITNSTILDGLIIEHGNTEGVSGSGNSRRSGGILCFGSPIIRNCTFQQNYGYYAAALYPRGSATTSDIIVDNCIFKNNQAQFGAGIYIIGGGTITDCEFSNNDILGSGGGIYAAGNTTTITDCIFKNMGGSDTRGAGIYGSTGIIVTDCEFENLIGIWGTSIYATDLTTITDSDFSNNTAQNNGAGVLMAFDAVVNISGCDFEGNIAGNGGALYAQSDSITVNIDDCYFFGNAATGGNGGAFFSLAGPLVTISNSKFDLNASDYGGAVAYSSGDGKTGVDRLTLMNCEFMNNIAEAQGGAINISNTDSVFITNCLIVDNEAKSDGNGGGISFNSGDTLAVYGSLMNCTFANNTGLFADNLSVFESLIGLGDLTIEIQNTLFYDVLTNSYNIEEGTPVVISNGGNLSNDVSLSQVFVMSSDFNNEDPMLFDISNGDYRLDGTSVCIDAGVAMNAPAVDVYNDARVGTPDIGAIEYPFLSNTTKLEIENGLDILPNPVQEKLNFTLENEWNGEVQFSIIDTKGQVIKQVLVTKNQSIINETIGVQNLAKGNYILLAKFGNEQISEVIVVID